VTSTLEVIDASQEDRAALRSASFPLPVSRSSRIDYSKLVVQKPWGHEYLLCGNEALAVWVLYLKPGHETSMHCHATKKTSLLVLHGQVQCSTLRHSRERKAGEGVLLHEGVFHQTRSISDGGTFVMEVETPPNKEDLIRLADKYNRTGTGYCTPENYSPRLPNHDYVTLERGVSRRNFKRLGNCTLSLLRISCKDELSELADSDLVCLLKGEIFDARGRSMMEHGEVKCAAAFRQDLCDRWQRTIDILVTRTCVAREAEGRVECDELPDAERPLHTP
jgi:mannose-6-phosphate isomerase-like protein (cupin superfamily)